MALSDLPDVLGMEERGASSNSGETSNMTGVGEQSPSLSQDMPAMMTQSMCIPSGSPMTAAPDIMTSSTSSLQGSRKSSGLRSESHDVKASCICTQFTSCYSSSMLLCTHNGFW